MIWNELQALLLDFDGLMIDTEWPAFVAWQEIYQRHGCELALEEWVTCVGGVDVGFHPTKNLEAVLERPVDHAGLMAEKEQRKAIWCDRMPLLPGVLDLLLAAQDRQLPLAVVSSSTREWVEHHLQRVQARHLVPQLVTREDVSRFKPDPMPYLTAAQRLGVNPAKTLVFEDSPNGVVAAKAAGMHCIAVPNRVTMHADLSRADRILSDIGAYLAP